MRRIIVLTAVMVLIASCASRCWAQITATPIPESEQVLGGNVLGDVYHNSVLGFSFTFPNEWTTASKAKIQAGNERNRATLIEFLRKNMPNADLAHITGPQVIFFASATGEGDGNPPVEANSITVTSVPWQGKLSTKYTQRLAKSMLKGRSLQIIGSTNREIEINGHEFFRADYKDLRGAAAPWLSRWQTQVNGYLLTVEIRALQQEQLDQLVACMQSFAFGGADNTSK